MADAFVFPGQGSQAVGMGRDLAAAFAPAREVFEEVDEALGQNLSRLMFEGPESDLTLTANAQPALMAVSLAVVRVLEKEGGVHLSDRARFVAGHSLGEYSALCAAGALPLAETARLLRVRGEAMQKAVPVGEGAMAALLGADLALAEAIVREAAQGEVCEAANDNAPDQIVISGARAAVERALVIAKEKGVKRAILLPVSAPFHSSMMASAAKTMEAALNEAPLATPNVPVIANVTAQPATEPNEIRRLLVAQVTGRVRWRESVLAMKDAGVSRLVEIGAGKVLAGLARRIDRDLNAASVGSPADVEAVLKIL
jgi:[acyl-carrier-protein] S-malonyltransferase